MLVELPGEPAPLRHYYAIGHEDRGKAEWTAVDLAGRDGNVASSPYRGLEPVEAVRSLTAARMAMLGLAKGEVRVLGWTYPRRWMT